MLLGQKFTLETLTNGPQCSLYSTFPQIYTHRSKIRMTSSPTNTTNSPMSIPMHPTITRHPNPSRPIPTNTIQGHPTTFAYQKPSMRTFQDSMNIMQKDEVCVNDDDDYRYTYSTIGFSQEKKELYFTAKLYLIKNELEFDMDRLSEIVRNQETNSLETVLNTYVNKEL